MTEYDLWIDESGGFDGKSQAASPSLVGGVLAPAGALSDQAIRKLAYPDESAGHAMEMKQADAQRVVLPALKAVRACGGHLVYFENRERISHWGNKELYLRLLAMGLAQLVRLLSSKGPFRLNITVALRLVPENGGLVEISPDEYRATLKQYIAQEFDSIRFTLSPSARVALTVLSARKEARLVLADYACNARYSIGAKKYAAIREDLRALFESEYVFTVSALPLESVIRARLAENSVCDALMAYYGVRPQLRKPRLFHEIMDAFCAMSYRLQRHQLRLFTSRIRAFAGRETDFERSEALLETVCAEVFGALRERGVAVQTDECLFGLRLSLADMFLREGDVIHAAPVMEALERVVSGMNYRAEHLAHLYLYRDKLALHQINAMDYGAAVDTMRQTIDTMELLIGVMSSDALLHAYFNGAEQIPSEYLGDAYCMMIYAELFLLRSDPGRYAETAGHIDTALQQYRYPGELERNQQYRSKCENEAGHPREALAWLLKTQEISMDGDISEACARYLRAAGNEDALSQTYCAMYYVEILENAARLGEQVLPDAMLRALEQEKSMLSGVIRPEAKRDIPSDTELKHDVFEDIFSDGKPPRRYHPLEIVLWKYGSFQWIRGSKGAAEEYWREAIAVCDENPSYTVLKLVSVAILLEWLGRSAVRGAIDTSSKVWRSLCSRADSLLKIGPLPEKMRDYAAEVKAFVDSEARTPEAAVALSRRIAF